MTTSRGRIVLIMGMHRSGTSMLARLLAAEGLPLGVTLLNRGRRDNVHGYWEQAEIVHIHEALLDGFDRTWHGPNGRRALPEGWLASGDTHMAKRRLMAIVKREITEADGLWGFKDPRTLCFLPLWREIIAELSLDPVFILAARAPAAVAASLMRRNRLRRDSAEAMWAANTITVLGQVGDELAAVIDYDDWFTRPDAIAGHLREVLGLPRARAPGLVPPIAALIDPNLRHHQGALGGARPAFEALHAALVSAAPQAPRQQDLATAIRAAKSALNDACPYDYRIQSPFTAVSLLGDQ
ncbi:sulfotransferase family protein [Acidisoma sp.]|uniref:sulfotransferase family protein n=1 Tax=Acidisoma sp. TaxID=1872115 RepID=UPI003B006616